MSRALTKDLTFVDPDGGSEVTITAGTEFRLDDSVQIIEVLQVAVRSWARAYRLWALEQGEGYDDEGNAWLDAVMQVDLMEEIVDEELLASYRLAQGAAITHNLDIKLFSPDNGNDLTGFAITRTPNDETIEVVLHLDSLHYDLRYNPEPIYTSFDILFWKMSSNHFPLSSQDEVQKVQKLLKEPGFNLTIKKVLGKSKKEKNGFVLCYVDTLNKDKSNAAKQSKATKRGKKSSSGKKK